MIDYTPINMKIWSRLGSSGAYGIAAVELVQNNPDILFLTADVCSFSGLDRLSENYPKNFYNVGISEQNLIGIAAGLAKEGFIPFVSTYAAFDSLRAADQIKVNMGYMNLPVKIVGLTSGLSVGILGPTHFCNEDIALIRCLPNIIIISPADCTETIKATIASAKINAPVYLRLTGGINNPPVYKSDYDFEIGKAITIKDGNDIAIIATGSMVFNSLSAAKLLEEEGISVKVVNMHTIKPLDVDAVRECFNTKLIITVEEHSVYGGLGSAVSEVVAMSPNSPPQKILGLSDEYKAAGSYTYLIDQYELNLNQIKEKILKTYKEITK